MAGNEKPNVASSASLDFHALCNTNGPEIYDYLRKVQKEQNEESISKALIEAVEAGGIPPVVFSVWLDLAQSPSSLLAAVKSHSRLTRKRALQRVGNNLAGKDWEDTWKLLGGVSGWLQLFRQASREDVQRLVCALQRCQTTVISDATKRSRITDLVKGLFPSIYPDSAPAEKDERQLDEQYVRLLPLSNTDVALHILDTLVASSPSVKLNEPALRLFLLNHLDVCKQRVIETTVRSDCEDSFVSWPDKTTFLKLRLLLLNDYPPRPSMFNPGWSGSMDFAYELLVKLSNASSADSMQNVVDALAWPLLRRSMQKRCGTSSHLKIIRALLAYVKSHPRAASKINISRNTESPGILSYILRLWSRKPEKYEELLIETFKLVKSSPYPSELAHNNQTSDALNIVKESLRYRLLRLIHLYLSGHPADIDKDEDLTLIAEKNWACHVFLLLRRSDAVKLLDRLINATDKIVPIHGWWQVNFRNEHTLLSRLKKNVQNIDPSVLWLILNRGSPEATAEAKKKVDESLNLATKTSASDTRLWHASAAFMYSVASADLELLQTVTEFNKRFVRDPESHNLLFNADNMCLTEHIRLLSGLGVTKETIPSTDHMKTCVIQANKILRIYLDIACKAMREPHFRPFNWNQILTMISKVLLARISVAETFQRQVNLSDEQIIDVFWKDTLKTYVEMETRWTQPEFRNLEFANARGPWLDAYHTEIGVGISTYPGLDLMDGLKPFEMPQTDGTRYDRLSPASGWFLDQLARGRDEIWKKTRLELNSDVAVLPACWPQGLPVRFHLPVRGQCLDSIRSADLDNMPYLQDKVKRIVFIAEDEANSPPPTEDIKEAIGPFIEAYTDCLLLYVVLGSPEGQQTRVGEAWDYATTKLNRNFKNRSESFTFWRPHFAGLFLSTKNKSLAKAAEDHDLLIWPPSDDRLSLPEDADFDGYFEFSPSELCTDLPPSFRWELTSLDVLLCQLTYDVVLPADYHWHELHELASTSRKRGVCSLFDRGFGYEKDVKRKNPRYQEAAVAMVILYLDSRKGGAASVLQQAFPQSLDSQRFPPLLLDAEFAADVNNTSTLAIEELSRFVERAPPQILKAIAQACVSRLKEIKSDEDANAGEISEIAFGCLCLLGKSDQPEIASELIFDAIIHLPDSSSWHRQALNKGLINRLEPKAAFQYLTKFAEYILDINESRRAKVSKLGAEALKEEGQPFIKVTTVKLVVDLLKSGDVFSLETALKLLFRFLRSFIQIDIRESLLKSIFQIYLAGSDATFSENTKNELLQVLESLVPFTGGLSERYATNEKMWDAIKPGGDLPEIGTETPLWDILMKNSSNVLLPARVRDHITQKVLLPSLLKSIEAHQRWLELFAQKYGLDVEIKECSIGPVRHGSQDQLEQTIKQHLDRIPAKFLNIWHERERFNLQQPAEIKAASSTVTRDVKIRDSIEGKYWQSAINEPAITAWSATKANNFLTHIIKTLPTADSAISVSQIHECIVDIARIMLLEYTSLQTPWSSFVTSFVNSNRNYVVNSSEVWKGRFEPVVRKLEALVSSFRTSAWEQADMAKRVPRILPNPLDFKLGLLEFPTLSGDKAKERAEAHELAKHLEAILTWLMKTNPVTYHLKLSKFLSFIGNVPTMDHRAIIALTLGTFREEAGASKGRELSALATTRIYLAKETINYLYLVTLEELVLDMNVMVSSWCASPNEEIREWGERAWSMHKWKKGDRWDPPQEHDLKDSAPIFSWLNEKVRT